MSELLRIDKLSACYQGHQEDTLKEIDLSLSRGKIIGLVGESGCGKTTLLKAVIGCDLHHYYQSSFSFADS